MPWKTLIDFNAKEDLEKLLTTESTTTNKDQIEKLKIKTHPSIAGPRQVSFPLVFDVQQAETTPKDLPPSQSKNPENSENIKCEESVTTLDPNPIPTNEMTIKNKYRDQERKS